MGQETGESSPIVARAILGGSFDPVHRGHLGMAGAAVKSVGLDGVMFVPCYVSPFKDGTIATGEQRYEMLTRAIEDEALEWASVSRYEIEREGPSYSWETAAYFADEEPETQWYWILGTDQWEAIEKWANPEFLRDHVRFIVLTRDGRQVREREGWQSRQVLFEHPASSTAIRSGFSEHQEWLTPGVRDYCFKNGLYGA